MPGLGLCSEGTEVPGARHLYFPEAVLPYAARLGFRDVWPIGDAGSTATTTRSLPCPSPDAWPIMLSKSGLAVITVSALTIRYLPRSGTAPLVDEV